MKRTGTFLTVAIALAALSAIGSVKLMDAKTHRDVTRVRSDLRSLAVALEGYYVDNMTYPMTSHEKRPPYRIPASLLLDFDSSKPEAPNANSTTAEGTWSRSLSTFRVRQPGERIITLTTPIAYVTRFPRDPFADDRAATYGAAARSRGWVVFSPGPMGWPEGGPSAWDGRAEGALQDQPILWYLQNLPRDPSMGDPYPAIPRIYDPTNGIRSGGFLWRTRQ